MISKNTLASPKTDWTSRVKRLYHNPSDPGMGVVSDVCLFLPGDNASIGFQFAVPKAESDYRQPASLGDTPIKINSTPYI